MIAPPLRDPGSLHGILERALHDRFVQVMPMAFTVGVPKCSRWAGKTHCQAHWRPAVGSFRPKAWGRAHGAEALAEILLANPPCPLEIAA